MRLTASSVTLTRFWEDYSVLLDYESMLEGGSTLRHLPEPHVQPFCPRWIWTPGHSIEREMKRSIRITRPTRDIVQDGKYDEDGNVQGQHCPYARGSRRCTLLRNLFPLRVRNRTETRSCQLNAIP